MSWLSLLSLVAAGVELVVVAGGFLVAGLWAAVGALIGSAIALAAQLTAILVLRPGMKAPGLEFVKRWSGGIALRGLSFVVLAVVMVLTKNTLPPLWVAAGWLVQMLTLLFAETAFLK